MENFIFQNPTKIIFGRGVHKEAGREVRKITGRVLFHYGGGSIKRTGLYGQVMESLKKENIRVFELAGVKPNPVLSLVQEGAGICRKNDIGLVLAVGGGSVIDSAKAIAVSAPYPGKSMWDFVEGVTRPLEALPVGVILTIPAAGSESSDVSVITNEDGMIKRGYHNELLRPRFAILNPELASTLPPFQVACGAVDIMSHVMERYFTRTENVDLTGRLCEATLKSVMANAPGAVKNPADYNPMAELMWAGTIAHNGILGTGRTGDWASHKIGHELSSAYGMTHGLSLAIIFPAWMRYVYRIRTGIFCQFAERVLDMDTGSAPEEKTIIEAIGKLKEFFGSLGLPVTLKDAGIGEERFAEMVEKTQLFGPIGSFKKLDTRDVMEIYRLALG
ncbi:MAG: iron-containing alcohol dehydrogenase [Actinobacteria bacterium]|nr:iron-containing alcohol dehydrogenase [Actinomycetota bacterium]